MQINQSTAKVLIVEDSEEIRESMRDVLEDFGFQVDLANNGSVALDRLRESTILPALILLDITMPVMDGYEFRALQMKEAKLSQIPVAMISADGHVQSKAARAGLTEYLLKPVELNELLALVGKYCRPLTN